MELRCYIIDDEPLAIEVLEAHIKKYGRLELAGTFQNAIEAFNALQKEPVDLIFLDIQMPGLTGIDFLKSLTDAPDVIFTTAYREYALEGFELNVLDYLLKPISFERFIKAMGKVSKTNTKEIAAISGPETDESLLFIPVDKKMVRVQLDSILYIESQRDYISIQTTAKKIKAHQQISTIEEKLPASEFLRIHRSFIVSVQKIESWSASEIEVPNKILPVGRTYKKQVQEILESRTSTL